jgi:hypothetical protein
VDDEVEAVRQRAKADRRGQRVVDDRDQPMPAGEGDHGFQVDDVEKRVGQSLDVEGAGARPEGALPRLRVVRVDEGAADPEPREAANAARKSAR